MAADATNANNTVDTDNVVLLADHIVAETAYRIGFARELAEDTGRREYERGLHEGYVLAIADVKALQHGLVRDAQLEKRRSHLCCPRCRLAGHRDGCGDCQDRTRVTLGDPMPGDYPGGADGIAWVKATWEKAGFGFPHWGPEWIHLSGPTVHWHKPCTAACYAYEPGWYRIADAIAIIETLPGDYSEALAELRAQALATARTAA